MTPAQPEYLSEIDHSRVLRAMRAEDDVGAVLRAHFELERAIVRCAKALFPNYAALNNRFFGQHLNALEALGARSGMFDAAKFANNLRNKFAHDGQEQLTDGDVESYSSKVQAGLTEKPDLSKFQISIDGAEPRCLLEFSRREQFVLLSSIVAMAIDTVPQRFKVSIGHKAAARISQD